PDEAAQRGVREGQQRLDGDHSAHRIKWLPRKRAEGGGKKSHFSWHRSCSYWDARRTDSGCWVGPAIESDLVGPANIPRNNRQEKETAMSTRKVLTLASMVAMLFSPAVFSAAASDAMDNPFQVLGESQDSGLGDLSPSYTAAEFQRVRVGGESQDSGLGDLSPSYAAAEFQRCRVAGESQDSGLGDLPPSYAAAEFQRYQVAGESQDSGLGNLSPTYAAAEFRKQVVVAAR